MLRYKSWTKWWVKKKDEIKKPNLEEKKKKLQKACTVVKITLKEISGDFKHVYARMKEQIQKKVNDCFKQSKTKYTLDYRYFLNC